MNVRSTYYRDLPACVCALTLSITTPNKQDKMAPRSKEDLDALAVTDPEIDAVGLISTPFQCEAC